MKTLVIANWKMYPATFKEAKKLVEATKIAAAKAKEVSVVLCPPAIYLRDFAKSRSQKIQWGAQHVRSEVTGAFTGDTSMFQAKDSGAQFVIMGHAERRVMGETDEDVKKKLTTALELDMTPAVCIGEPTRNNKESGEYFEYVKKQIRTIFSGLPVPALKKILIVYEPRWVIGGTVSMTPHDMHEMAVLIRKTLVETHGETALHMQVVYGGSVNETNAVAMMRSGDVQGLLIGHASIEAQKFTEMLKLLQNA